MTRGRRAAEAGVLAVTIGAALMFGGGGIGHADRTMPQDTCPFSTYFNPVRGACECGYGQWDQGAQQCDNNADDPMYPH